MTFCTKKIIQYLIYRQPKPIFEFMCKKKTLELHSIVLFYRGSLLFDKSKEIKDLRKKDTYAIVKKIKEGHCYECGNTRNCRYFNPHP